MGIMCVRLDVPSNLKLGVQFDGKLIGELTSPECRLKGFRVWADGLTLDLTNVKQQANDTFSFKATLTDPTGKATLSTPVTLFWKAWEEYSRLFHVTK
ncbi:MAG: hypothetical protein FJ109_10830 [Deltaproteobacteria bacterium]|nr:hypothetical protein [Deltaproteobacteria bacterium]